MTTMTTVTTTFFQEYLQHYQPYKDYWNYEDGCVLLGCRKLYEATGEAQYAAFITEYLSERVAEDGTIPSYPADRFALDSFNCGKALFFAAAQTGEARYHKAIAWQAAQIRQHPRTKSGLCWHKRIYPEQIWLDGIYMAAPFFAEYALYSGKSGIYPQIGHCFDYLYQHLRDPKTGLYYHALDESRCQPWAHPETGLSRTYWLRGEGWLLMALADTYALLPEHQSKLREQLAQMLTEASEALLQYRTETGLLCQVIDRQTLPQNYTESSGTLMAAYALMTGAAYGALPAEQFETGAAMLQAVIREKLQKTSAGTVLKDICSAAGLGGTPLRDGTCAYYLSEPAVSNDPKGVGALMLACGQHALISRTKP